MSDTKTSPRSPAYETAPEGGTLDNSEAAFRIQVIGVALAVLAFVAGFIAGSNAGSEDLVDYPFDWGLAASAFTPFFVGGVILISVGEIVRRMR